MADVKKTTKAKAPVKKAVEVKTLEQLNEELVTLQNDYRESRRSHQMGELVNPHTLTVQRKSIARAHTAIRNAEIAATKEEN
jgi:ribosomal protein L29